MTDTKGRAGGGNVIPFPGMPTASDPDNERPGLIPAEFDTLELRRAWVDGNAAMYALARDAMTQNDLAHQRELQAAKEAWQAAVAIMRIENAGRLADANEKFRQAERLATDAQAVIERMRGEAAVTEGRLDEARRSSAAADPASLIAALAGLVGQMHANAAPPANFVPVAAPAAATSAGTEDSPLFSSVVAEYIAGSGHLDLKTRDQAQMTARLLIEFLGDRPIRDYDGKDAKRFLDLLRRLPSTHGKSRTPVHALEAIAAADAKDEKAVADARRRGVPENQLLSVRVARLTEKTVKRHSTSMSSVWKFALPIEYVDKVIFSGFVFAGAKSGSRARDDWSAEDVRALLGRPWRSPGISEHTFRMLVAIAAYSGMRLEEICRLRPSVDFERHDGKWFILVQRHKDDSWKPKTDAGERAIPVHPELTKLGLMHHVERMKKAGKKHLFHDLEASGRYSNLSASFSKAFSNFKIQAGVRDEVSFHSWRHNVVTILNNEDATIRPEWINALMGHKQTSGSEGPRTYLKRIGAQNLAKTVSRIRYEDFDLPSLLRGEPERAGKIKGAVDEGADLDDAEK